MHINKNKLNGNEILNNKAQAHKMPSEQAIQLYNGIRSYFGTPHEKNIEGISEYKNDFENIKNIRDCNHKQLMYILKHILNTTDNNQLTDIINKQSFLLYFENNQIDG
eukprot:220862_1